MRCESCQGQGHHRVVVKKFTLEGNSFVTLEPCTNCGGTGLANCCEGSERHGQIGEPIKNGRNSSKDENNLLENKFAEPTSTPDSSRKGE